MGETHPSVALKANLADLSATSSTVPTKSRTEQSPPQTSAPSANPPPPNLRRWFIVGLALVAMGWLGRWSAPTPKAPALQHRTAAEAEAGEVVASAEAAPAPPRPPKRPSATSPARAKPAITGTAPVAMTANVEDRQQAEQIVGRLAQQMLRLAPSDPHAPIEAAITNADLYIQGWMDAVAELSPGLDTALGEEIETTLCRTKPVDDILALLLMRVVHKTPTMSSPRMFDCLFKRRSQTEDVVTWEALDAWRASGLPESDAIAKLHEQATKPQTLARFDPNRGRRALPPEPHSHQAPPPEGTLINQSPPPPTSTPGALE